MFVSHKSISAITKAQKQEVYDLTMNPIMMVPNRYSGSRSRSGKNQHAHGSTANREQQQQQQQQQQKEHSRYTLTSPVSLRVSSIAAYDDDHSFAPYLFES